MDDKEYLELLRAAKERLPKGEAGARFELPKAIVQVQGRQTIIRNFQEILKTLRREPAHLAKYLFKELAVPGDIGQELSFQGKFSQLFINKKIESYAKEFVFCEECGKPDTNLIKQDRIHILKCEACGARRPVRNIK